MKCSYRFFWAFFLISLFFNFAKSPVYLKILIKLSLSSVLRAVLTTGPIASIAFSKNSSSEIPSTNITGNWVVGLSSAVAYLSTTWVSWIWIASRSFALSITILLLVPKILKLAFSSPSPSTLTLRAVRTANFYSNILVAIEYSIMSMSAAPSVSLLFKRVRIDFVLSNSSMKLISRICRKLLSSSTDTQNMIGAAFLKFCQKSVSSHS